MEENGLKYGSYHQCYRLDGELIAIGVLDLLPNCVSSVYFLYKPDLQKHGMGKLAALREIALAIEEGYGYYYLGMCSSKMVAMDCIWLTGLLSLRLLHPHMSKNAVQERVPAGGASRPRIKCLSHVR